MRNLGAGIIGLLLAGSAVAFFVRQSQLDHLREENEKLREVVVEADRLESENAQFEGGEIDSTELERLRPVVFELARMRGKISRLRGTAAVDPHEAQEEIAALEAAAEEAEERASLIEAYRASQEVSKAVRRQLYELRALYELVARHLGSDPASFQELEAGIRALDAEGLLPDHWSGEAWWKLLHTPNELLGSNVAYFEFVPPGGPTTRTQPSALWIRERAPRRLPDGRWVRYYAYFHGVKEVILPENRFDDWEREERDEP